MVHIYFSLLQLQNNGNKLVVSFPKVFQLNALLCKLYTFFLMIIYFENVIFLLWNSDSEMFCIFRKVSIQRRHMVVVFKNISFQGVQQVVRNKAKEFQQNMQQCSLYHVYIKRVWRERCLPKYSMNLHIFYSLSTTT